MTTLVIATRNAHKVQEIRAILGEHFRYLSLADFVEAPPVVEDQPTFARYAEPPEPDERVLQTFCGT